MSRLPNGAITKDDFEFLWTRVESKLKETGEWEKGDFENAIHLYPTNRAVNMENLKKLSKLGEPIVRIEATHVGRGAKNATSNKAMCLPNTDFAYACF